jgi:hypothetical protein
MTLVHDHPGEHVICYRFRRETGFIKLHLWEPPGPLKNQESQHLPYLYAVNFTFTSMQDAEAFLHTHLLNNGAFNVPKTDFPPEGQITILPFPTWKLDVP